MRFLVSIFLAILLAATLLVCSQQLLRAEAPTPLGLPPAMQAPHTQSL
jgi:hypothetical protein